MNTRTLLTLAVVAASALLAGCAGAPVQEEDRTTARDGARIWTTTCNNCHNLRQGTEYTARQWPVIVNHMRTRAGLTRSQARAVAAFLQRVAEDAAEPGSGDRGGSAPATPSPATADDPYLEGAVPPPG